MASLVFTDATGSVTLTNDKPAPGDRFSGWKPLVNPVGPIHHALGTGIPYKWTHRNDRGASFALTQIPNSRQEQLARLKEHLESGGSVTVTTDDPSNSTYTGYLWPGSDVEISAPDPKTLERRVALSFLNADGTHAVCLYA